MCRVCNSFKIKIDGISLNDVRGMTVDVGQY